MESGDVIRLLDQDGIVLTVTAGQEAIEPRDAKNLSVIQWTGVYSDGVYGTAQGSIVHKGPLTGLLAVQLVPLKLNLVKMGKLHSSMNQKRLMPYFLRALFRPMITPHLKFLTFHCWKVWCLEKAHLLRIWLQPSMIQTGTS